MLELREIERLKSYLKKSGPKEINIPLYSKEVFLKLGIGTKNNITNNSLYIAPLDKFAEQNFISNM